MINSSVTVQQQYNVMLELAHSACALRYAVVCVRKCSSNGVFFINVTQLLWLLL
jgi:hypothetical protein